MDFYKGNIPILDYNTSEGRDLAHPKRAAYGQKPRDFNEHPLEMFDPPSGMTIIPMSDWDAIYDEQEQQQSSAEHLYLSGPGGTPLFVNLDQNGDGYCWVYSVGHAIMMNMILCNHPLIRINPHSAGAILKNGRNEGGWCGLGAQFARTVGFAPEGNAAGQWPLHSRNVRFDTPEMRAVMKKYRTTEEWVDLTRPVYDVDMAIEAYATALMCRQPSPSDFSFWGHSVCGIRWVRIERGSWGPLILNSWLGWGRFGLAVLRGSQARPDSMLSIRSIRAA